MNTLQERLGVAVESDAARYSGADFAAARGASIAGRVRRRRTARAAGYGGGAMLAVGVLAVGGARMPWGVFGAGLDVGAADCVTASAQASAGSGSDTYTLTTVDGSRTVEIAVIDGRPQVADQSGTRIRERADGGFEVTLANGAVFDVTLIFDGDKLEGMSYNERQPGSNAAALGEMREVNLTTITTANVPAETGGSVVTFTQVSTGEVLTAYVNGPGVSIDETGDGPPFLTFHEDDGTYSLDFTDGARVFFTADGETATAVRVEAPAQGAASQTDKVISLAESLEAPSPSADCLTSEPSVSAIDEPEPSWGGEIEVAPGEASSPFQCGFVFPAPVGSTGVVGVKVPQWISAADAEQEIRSEYADPEDARLQLSGNDVPVVEFSTVSSWPDDREQRILMRSDPGPEEVQLLGGSNGSPNTSGFLLGAQFVLQADDTVIATVDPATLPDGVSSQYTESRGPTRAILLGLDLTAGLTACPGVDPAELKDAQAVAVAGTKAFNEDGTEEGPYYAWQYITRG